MPRYSQSSPYPTGRAPLAFDLSDQMWNIAQQRIQNRKQEIEDQQKEISDNEKILLTALDFETVKGAQDKFAQDMATRIDQMTTKWSERMKSKGGILDTNDKLELLRDKRDIENRIQVGAANVAQYDDLRKQVYLDKDGKIFDKKKSLENLGKFALNGDIGYKSPMDAVVMQPQAWGQSFMAKVQDAAEGMKIFDKNTFSQYPTGIVEEGQTKWGYTNKPKVENLKRMMQLDPEWQDLAKENYGQAMELLNSIDEAYTVDINDYEPVKTTSTKGAGTKTPAQQRADEEKQEKFGSFNNLALNLMDRDQATVSSIKNTGFGNIAAINYTQEPDGEYMHVHFQPTSANDTRTSERIKMPKDENDAEGKKIFYSKLWNVLPAEYKKGVEFDDLPKLMKPRSGKFTGTQEPFYGVKNVEKALDQAIKEPKKSFFQTAADTIKKYVPGLKVRATIDGLDIADEEGGGFKRYNLKTKGKNTANTPEALKERIMGSLNKEPQVFEINGEQFTIPADEVDEFLKEAEAEKATVKRVK